MTDERVKAARSLLLRAVESLDNHGTLSTENRSSQPQLHAHSSGSALRETPITQPTPLTAPAAISSSNSTVLATERNRLFNFGFRRSSAKRTAYNQPTKSKKKRLHTWCHDFVCFWSTKATKPPSSLETANLIRAGLGRKQLLLFEGDGSQELHAEILQAFPRLREGGGYELMRVAESGQRTLMVIPSPSDGYSVTYLREVLRQAKVYIRPMQKDLTLKPCDVSATVSCTTFSNPPIS